RARSKCRSARARARARPESVARAPRAPSLPPPCPCARRSTSRGDRGRPYRARAAARRARRRRRRSRAAACTWAAPACRGGKRRGGRRWRAGAHAASPSVLHLRDLTRHEPLEESPGPLAIEERIGGLDAEEEAVAGGEREAGHVEDGMVGHREPV